MENIIENNLPKELNPFANQYFKVKVRVLTEGDKLVTDGTLVLPKETLLEAEPYVKKFRSMQIRDAIIDLKPTAAKLWTWIEYSLPHGCDSIAINKDMFMKRSNVTRQAYARAIKQLLEGSFICRSSLTDTYFINPRLIFFGSRIAKYPNNLDIKHWLKAF